MSAPDERGRFDRAAGFLAAVLGTLCWGSGFPATKLLLTELPALPLLIVRFLIAAVVYLVMLVSLRGTALLPRKARWRLVLVALAGPALNSLGVTVAIDYIGAATSSLVIMLVPILTGLLAALSGQERLRARQLQGFAVALAGLVVVVLLGGTSAELGGASLAGLVFLFGGALGFAVYNVHSRPLLTHYSAIEVSSYLGILAGLGMLSFLLVDSVRAGFAQVGQLSLSGWLLALYLGIFSNALVFVLWYWALRRLGANRLALFSYLIPVWAVSGSALLLGERITHWLPVGVSLVVVGILLANRPAGAAIWRWRSASAERG